MSKNQEDQKDNIVKNFSSLNLLSKVSTEDSGSATSLTSGSIGASSSSSVTFTNTLVFSGSDLGSSINSTSTVSLTSTFSDPSAVRSVHPAAPAFSAAPAFVPPPLVLQSSSYTLAELRHVQKFYGVPVVGAVDSADTGGNEESDEDVE